MWVSDGAMKFLGSPAPQVAEPQICHLPYFEFASATRGRIRHHFVPKKLGYLSLSGDGQISVTERINKRNLVLFNLECIYCTARTTVLVK
jgi:hypothetical protein